MTFMSGETRQKIVEKEKKERKMGINVRRTGWLALSLLLCAQLVGAQIMVSGVVRDGDGSPVEGAAIFFINQADSTLGEAASRTAADGAYAVDLAPIVGSTGIGAASWGRLKGGLDVSRGKLASALGLEDLLFEVYIQGDDIESFSQRNLVVPDDRELDFTVVRLPVPQESAIDSALAETIFQVFQAAFFASLIQDPTTVEGVSGQLMISGNTWAFEDYSPDGELFIAGELEVKKDQFPRIPVKGDLLLSGAAQGTMSADMTVILEGLNFSVEGVLKFNGQELDIEGL